MSAHFTVAHTLCYAVFYSFPIEIRPFLTIRLYRSSIELLPFDTSDVVKLRIQCLQSAKEANLNNLPECPHTAIL